MNTDTPFNSQFQSPYEGRAQNNQVSTKSQYRRRDSSYLFHIQDLDWNPESIIPSSLVDDQQNTITAKAEEGQKILDPERQDEEINDPKRDQPDGDFPDPNDEADSDRAKIVPKQDKSYLTNDGGSIIKNPITEVEVY